MFFSCENNFLMPLNSFNVTLHPCLIYLYADLWILKLAPPPLTTPASHEPGPPDPLTLNCDTMAMASGNIGLIKPYVCLNQKQAGMLNVSKETHG